MRVSASGGGPAASSRYGSSWFATGRPLWAASMDLGTLVVAYCIPAIVRDLGRERRLRPHVPVVAGSKVLTTGIIGEFHSLDTDQSLHTDLAAPLRPPVPSPLVVHRTTFLHEAVNLRMA